MKLSEIMLEMWTQAKKSGRAEYRTLSSGLTLCARIQPDGKRVITLSRAGHPKGPSTGEANTVARYAGWEDYGWKADENAKTITIWQKPAAQQGVLL
jgi:hypothetical protein